LADVTRLRLRAGLADLLIWRAPRMSLVIEPCTPRGRALPCFVGIAVSGFVVGNVVLHCGKGRQAMQQLAHLRFADDVFAVVTALKKLGSLEARDAREVFRGAPEGWFVIVMTGETAFDLIGVVARASRAGDFADELLCAQIEPEDDHFIATFLHLRGRRHTLH
jgi:hypothetical protein